MNTYNPMVALTPGIAITGTEFTNYHLMDQLVGQLTPVIIKTVNEYVNIKIEDIITTNFEKIAEKNLEIMDKLLDEKFDRFLSDIKNPTLDNDNTPIVIIEEMSKDEAKNKVKEFFSNYDKEIYPSELSEILRIDYELIWEILKELEESGDIK